MEKFLKYNFLLIFAGIVAIFAACLSHEKVQTIEIVKKADTNQAPPFIQFAGLHHDFGEITKGEIVSFDFEFSNTGGSNLIITEVRPGCGCTVADFTREPVAPGKKGKVNVVFDSQSYTGNVYKSLKVLTNASADAIKLEISAFVKFENLIDNTQNQ